ARLVGWRGGGALESGASRKQADKLSVPPPGSPSAAAFPDDGLRGPCTPVASSRTAACCREKPAAASAPPISSEPGPMTLLRCGAGNSAGGFAANSAACARARARALGVLAALSRGGAPKWYAPFLKKGNAGGVGALVDVAGVGEEDAVGEDDDDGGTWTRFRGRDRGFLKTVSLLLLPMGGTCTLGDPTAERGGGGWELYNQVLLTYKIAKRSKGGRGRAV
ncbi:hypothetical protein E2562_003588, partial [Oryza meyeriana var. granulata]